MKRRWILYGLAMVLLVIVAATVAKQLFVPRPPGLVVVSLDGTARTLTLPTIRAVGNVPHPLDSDASGDATAGGYTGALLRDLVDADAEYTAVALVTEDGESVRLGRERVEDAGAPVLVAYACNGVEVPSWRDGFCVLAAPAGAADGAPDGGPPPAPEVVPNVREIRLLAE